jgi:hypothetical protein
MPTPKTKQPGGISSESVQAKTGKTWPEWIAALDAEGCQKMTHKEIVAVVSSKFGIGAWWQQMVTVGYEQARGLRAKHQETDGFAASVSKTLSAPMAAVSKAWTDSRLRKKWLAESFTIRTATANKSLRLTWAKPASSLSVNFYVKGEGKTQITVQHEKLASAKEVAQLKKFWGEKLNSLQVLLEK